MSEKKFETVSSIVDNYQQNDETFEELLNDSNLSETWDRYHLIGDVMRNDTPNEINLDLSTEIAAAIAKEPEILAPKVKSATTNVFKAKVIQLARPFGQVAIAASAAWLMIIGVQQNSVENDVVLPANQVVKTMPFAGVAEPVSLNFEQPSRTNQKQAFIEQQRRFQALLSDHQQQVKLSSVKSEQLDNNQSTDKVEEPLK